jgi:hypothetical protein
LIVTLPAGKMGRSAPADGCRHSRIDHRASCRRGWPGRHRSWSLSCHSPFAASSDEGRQGVSLGQHEIMSECESLRPTKIYSCQDKPDGQQKASQPDCEVNLCLAHMTNEDQSCGTSPIRSTRSPGSEEQEGLCPKDADGPTLLALSEVDPEHPGRRFATDGRRAYCGHEHSPDCWHGFPVEWRKVPAKLRNAWLADGRVSKRSVRELW